MYHSSLHSEPGAWCMPQVGTGTAAANVAVPGSAGYYSIIPGMPLSLLAAV